MPRVLHVMRLSIDPCLFAESKISVTLMQVCCKRHLQAKSLSAKVKGGSSRFKVIRSCNAYIAT